MHADFESPGIIVSWAKARGYQLTVVKPYRNESLPEISSFNFLIIMGGPQSGTRCDEFLYLQNEIHLIKKAIQQNKIILGFCLGAQLIGEALGAAAARSPEKEIGVYPITLTQAGKTDALLEGMPQSFKVIHWHNDMPGLLTDSIVLAYSEGCPRQIVRYKQRVYGFQCHLEITLQGIETMISEVPNDLNPSRFTQSKQQLLSQDYEIINHYMLEILDKIVQI